MSISSNVNLDWLGSQFPDLCGLTALAVGGQKQVFSASHDEHGDVVLKLMHPGSDPERTTRELAAATTVEARRMPRIYSRGQISGNTGTFIWFLEQRISGEPLEERIARGPLEYQALLRLALHVSETLVAAEAAQIVHRDVKPANILVGDTTGYWLIDFGVARHLALDSITDTAAPVGCGTLGYAPGEQCRNDKPDIDARADLFALGVTLYEAATGCNPHREGARDPLEVIRRVSHQPLPRLGDPIPEEFADLVATLAQPNCIHRIQTASEAYAWISELCDSEGVE